MHILKLDGQEGYQNAEEELNRVCSLYGKGKYAENARSINMEDINKITGYDPKHTGVNVNKATKEQIEAGEIFAKSLIFQYGNKITFSWDGTAKPQYESSVKNGNLKSHTANGGFFWYDGKNWNKTDYTTMPGKICELTSNYYYYYPETLTSVDDITQEVGLTNTSVEREMLFNPEQDCYYWVASRYVLCSNNAVSFGAMSVQNGGIWDGTLFESRGVGVDNGYGLRPIVTLQPNIKLKKDTNGVWQFVAE